MYLCLSRAGRACDGLRGGPAARDVRPVLRQPAPQVHLAQHPQLRHGGRRDQLAQEAATTITGLLLAGCPL